MLPRQAEVQGSCPDAIALDDDIEVRLAIRGRSGVEQHPAGRPVATDIGIFRIREDLVQVRRIDRFFTVLTRSKRAAIVLRVDYEFALPASQGDVAARRWHRADTW